jgi:diketogulonate reductase-like aldo/keto reductase
VLRNPTVIAIPKAADIDHLSANRQALDLRLSDEDLAAIDAEFPPPVRKTRLAML